MTDFTSDPTPGHDGFEWRPDVLAIVHDLRSPLSVIAGYAQMLSSGDVGEIPESAQRAVTAITTKAAEMRALLDGMLDVERAATGVEAAARVQALDLSRLAREALDRAGPRADFGGDALDLEAPMAVPVRADPRFVGRILDNLINNALTHGRRPGRVMVTVAHDDRTGQVRVQDNGDGLPAAVRDRVFTKFAGDPQEAAADGGGLGLYISRVLASKIGGSLSHEEPFGGGATFVLRLPLADGLHGTP